MPFRLAYHASARQVEDRKDNNDDNILNIQESARVVLEFSNPNKVGITYSTRLTLFSPREYSTPSHISAIALLNAGALTLKGN